uniref:Uncharacterized protein n=1 Tax=Romanomermis culicivorax TaxID=13658 RepID=A0A915L5S4_ROMCU
MGVEPSNMSNIFVRNIFFPRSTSSSVTLTIQALVVNFSLKSEQSRTVPKFGRTPAEIFQLLLEAHNIVGPSARIGHVINAPEASIFVANLESHMFQKMGDAVILVGFVTGTGINPNSDRASRQTAVFRSDAETIFKTANFRFGYVENALINVQHVSPYNYSFLN